MGSGGVGLVVIRSIGRSVLVFCLLGVQASAALAQAADQDKRRYQAGQFDFYVLSLSWSPSFCAALAGRTAARTRGGTIECGTQPHGFIVHGLWPQYERGFPQYCQMPPPRLNRRIVSAMLDLMPAPRLVFSEWDRHGTCSGLSPRDYFDTVRRARAVVNIPAQYADLQKPLNVSPAAVEDAFIKANPDLAQGDMAVACEKRRLTEVRLCLSKDLKFRACPQIVARSCGRARVLMPPLHGSASGAAGAGGSG